MTTTDYRGKVIPDTNTFNVVWWMYLVFVSFASVYLVLMFIVGVFQMIQRKISGGLIFIHVLIMLVIIGINVCIRWFALMWKLSGLMIGILVGDGIMLLLTIAEIIMLLNKPMNNGEMEISTVRSLMFLQQDAEQTSLWQLAVTVIAAIFEIILVSILLSEVLKI